MTENRYQHFLDLSQIEMPELRQILDSAKQMKTNLKNDVPFRPLEGKLIALVFEKPSTRTRVSFEAAMYQLGGAPITLNSDSIQISRGETIADTARVLSRYVDIIMIRTFKHETLQEMAKHATVPVINGLTDFSHPCQVMADILTFEEHRGFISGKTIAWVGDCNNMTNTWIQAAEKFGFTLHIACPDELAPPRTNLKDCVKLFTDPKEAVTGADCVMTDTWISMGDSDAGIKLELLKDFQVNDDLMALAKPDAVFMHCLPAHRGEEVTNSVLEGAKSVIWDEAENRLHVQKSIILWCCKKLGSVTALKKAV